ncbi:hypothetical protein [Vibrio sp. D54]|uniref:hypothetical protein n=1 Tax=Vibrio sp. D54 TaxID=2912256 RepID=UPI001F4241C3|nr:hypothetical protein [Vibrio sp. D54]MCF7509155.1 hypothetical protein [Vibrio sp. D54]
MKVLVNASAAREGGALTILNSYLESKVNDNNEYIVLSPVRPNTNSKNINWHKACTFGFGTYFFSLIYVLFYYARFDCHKIISFNNINTIFPIRSRITYFHNFLILDSPEHKYKLLRFTLRHLNQQGCLYIFQTPYVEERFKECIRSTVASQVCWPGIDIPLELPRLKRYLSETLDSSKRMLVWPVSDPSLSHKNFKLVNRAADRIKKLQIIIPSLRPKTCQNEGITYVGPLDRAQLLRLISCTEGVIITSEVETVCLPIFEAIGIGKNAYVYKQPYLKGIRESWPCLNGLIEFNSIEELEEVFNQAPSSKVTQIQNDFCKCDWSF